MIDKVEFHNLAPTSNNFGCFWVLCCIFSLVWIHLKFSCFLFWIVFFLIMHFGRETLLCFMKKILWAFLYTVAIAFNKFIKWINLLFCLKWLDQPSFLILDYWNSSSFIESFTCIYSAYFMEFFPFDMVVSDNYCAS